MEQLPTFSSWMRFPDVLQHQLISLFLLFTESSDEDEASSDDGLPNEDSDVSHGAACTSAVFLQYFVADMFLMLTQNVAMSCRFFLRIGKRRR